MLANGKSDGLGRDKGGSSPISVAQLLKNDTDCKIRVVRPLYDMVHKRRE